MTTQVCPDANQLKDLLLGRLSEEQHASLESHLLQCDDCVERAGQLKASDEILDAIKTPQMIVSNRREITEVVRRGKQIFQETLAEQIDETIDSGSHVPTDDTTSELATVSYSFLRPAETSDELGRLGNYRILRLLGQGGMGMVFLAEEVTLGRQVALKVVAPDADENAKTRFLREARALAAVESDHIVNIHRVGDIDDLPYLEMPVLHGESLHDCLRKKLKLETELVCKLGEEVAEGLAAAHERGLLHRDIKPGNIWIESPRDRAKILDFGLARGNDDPELTSTGAVVGTPRYMSPEQAEGKTVDHLSDLFSLGSVLYHCAAGEPAFSGNSTAATLISVVRADCKPIGERCPNMPKPLADLITQLLRRDPSERPPSARVVAQRFATIHHSLSSDAAISDTAVATPSQSSPNDTKSKGSHRKMVFIAGIAAAVLGWLIYLATVSMRIETPDGTILVEIDSAEDSVPVNVLGNQSVEITDPNDGQTIRVTVDKAKQLLHMEKDGFKAVLKSFDLLSDSGTHIAVRFEQKQTAKPVAKANKRDTDEPMSLEDQRRVVEWVVRRGGTVTHSSEYIIIDDVSQIPDQPMQDVFFTLKHLDDLADEELSIFENWSGRAGFNFEATPITGHGFAFLSHIDITSLWCQSCTELEPDAFHELEGSVTMENLLFLSSNAGDELAQSASTMKNLQSIGLGRESTGKSLEWLASCEQLHTVSISNTKIRHDDVAALSQLPALINLTIDGEHLNATFFDGLADVKQLKSLQVDEGEINLELFDKLDQLEQLDLSYRDLTDTDFTPLTRMQSLNMLTLRSTNLSDDALRALGDLLPECKIWTDDGWLQQPNQ